MAKPGTFKNTPIEKVLAALNETFTKAEAASKLETTTQTLDKYIKDNSIERQCKYVAAKVINTSAQTTTGDAQ